MKQYLIFFCIFVLLPFMVKAQADTAVAARNLKQSTFRVSDKGEVTQDTVRKVGRAIPHLVVFNLASDKVTIKLSNNAKNWTNFDLESTTKNLYRCDGFNQ